LRIEFASERPAIQDSGASIATAEPVVLNPQLGRQAHPFLEKTMRSDRSDRSLRKEGSSTVDEQRIITLVQRAQRDDRDAFGELVRHFEPTVFAIVLMRMRNRSEARELTQDVLIQAMRKIGQLREPERFAGWLRQIAVRMSINRAVRRPHESPMNPNIFSGLASEPETPLDDLLRQERSDQVWGGLKRLRDLDRQTLIAFYMEGQSLKQMSDVFDSPIGTIKRRLHTARSRLKEQLASMQPASPASA
jgi:RNA polymerase sigma-70 factor (ECF subfamily)